MRAVSEAEEPARALEVLDPTLFNVLRMKRVPPRRFDALRAFTMPARAGVAAWRAPVGSSMPTTVRGGCHTVMDFPAVRIVILTDGAAVYRPVTMLVVLPVSCIFMIAGTFSPFLYFQF